MGVDRGASLHHHLVTTRRTKKTKFKGEGTQGDEEWKGVWVFCMLSDVMGSPCVCVREKYVCAREDVVSPAHPPMGNPSLPSSLYSKNKIKREKTIGKYIKIPTKKTVREKVERGREGEKR